MPHRCVRCNTLYADGSAEILKGCACGARLFLFVKQKHIEDGKKLISKLSEKEKEQIEADIFDIANIKEEGVVEEDAPVILDFESIRIAKPGQYELDLVHLFKNDPLVFKLEEGKYMIDIAQAFGKKE